MGEIAEQLIEGQIEGYLDSDGCYIWNDEEYKEERRQKKKRNYDFSVKLLTEKGIKFKISWPSHVILDNFDFYPSTGLFINKKTKKRGRGVYNLIKLLW